MYHKATAQSRSVRMYVLTLTSLLSMFFMGSSGAAEKSGGKLTLSADGATDYVIVVPDGEDQGGRVKKAADLLQSVLSEATGTKFTIVKESAAPEGKPRICLGRTRAAEAAKLPLDSLKGWTFLKRVVGKDVFLVGLDVASVNDKKRAEMEYLGTLKAVTSFLKDEVGVRFLLPGPNGLYVPKTPTLEVDAGLNVTRTPTMMYCSGGYRNQLYDVAQNQFAKCSFGSYSGHSYYWAVPKEKYAKDHPEYFALLGGVRDPSQNHLCISNPDVQRLMVEEMEKKLDMGYEWVELGQTDGYRPCECDKCNAISADRGERLWIVHRKLAEIIGKSRPGKKVVIIAYSPTKNPPTTFNKFPDNVVIEMCSYSPESFARWRPYASEFTVYLYNWTEFQVLGCAPKRTPRFVGEQVRFLLSQGVKGIYKDGFLPVGLEGPVCYVFCGMLKNPAADQYELADEFYRLAYGKAKTPMKAFFDAMHERLELYSITGFGSFSTSVYQGRGSKWLSYMPVNPEDAISYFFPPKLMLFMENQLRQAMPLDNDPRVQARLRLVKREFNYLKNLSAVFYYYNTYRLSPSWTTFDLLGAEVEKRNAMIESWYDENGKMKIEDGWPWFFGNPKKETLYKNVSIQGALSAPFNWDVKRMRELKILPGALGARKMKVHKLTAPIEMDGIPDETAWKKADHQKLMEDHMGALEDNTSFQAVYDGQFMYFAFVCRMSRLKPQNGSLPVSMPWWAKEYVTLYLDPFGTREKYYLFLENAYTRKNFLVRNGFITDPLDPNYGKADPSWKGGPWKYAVNMDFEKKLWTMEVQIPFTTMEVPKPEPGTLWTGNFCRQHFLTEKKHENSSWSPVLRDNQYPDRGATVCAFGDIVFE